MGDEKNRRSLEDRIQDELLDSLDEELEQEIDDDRLARLLDGITDSPQPEGLDRSFYFKELLRLQRELVKLQDWVVHQKLKVVVLFEGRDSAGKGGAIKRVTQRLNPRICRTVALPAPTERERTQWYFQRYVTHLPGAGEIVLFDRSWYNRAGVERVMGFCSETDIEEFFRTVPEFERMLVRSGIVLIKYWFSITDEQQNLRFQMRIHDPLKQWKLSPMDLEVAAPLGGIHQGQRGDAGAHPHPGGALVGRRGQRQEEGAAELHPPSAAADPVPGGRAPPDRAAAARAQAGLHARAGAARTARPGRLLGSSRQWISSGVSPSWSRRRHSTPKNLEGHRLNEITVAIEKLGFQVVRARRIEDAEIAVQTDAAIGCMVVDWGKKGLEGKTASLINLMRRRGLEMPIVMLVRRKRLEDIPVEVLDYIDGYIFLAEETPEFIAKNLRALRNAGRAGARDRPQAEIMRLK